MSNEKEQRQLEAAGWQPVEKEGGHTWRHPGNGFLFSEEAALERLKANEEDKKSQENAPYKSPWGRRWG